MEGPLIAIQVNAQSHKGLTITLIALSPFLRHCFHVFPKAEQCLEIISLRVMAVSQYKSVRPSSHCMDIAHIFSGLGFIVKVLVIALLSRCRAPNGGDPGKGKSSSVDR